MHGSADPEPDPHQNVMDPEHWFNHQAVVVLCPSESSVCVCIGKEEGVAGYGKKPYCSQGFGSGSVLDPDSTRSLDPDPDPDPGGQKCPTKVFEILCFKVLDVLF
jgi:hypothetical protein